jgi:hypothetical protein
VKGKRREALGDVGSQHILEWICHEKDPEFLPCAFGLTDLVSDVGQGRLGRLALMGAGFLSGVATASALAPEPIISKGLAITAGVAQVIGIATDALSAAPSNNQPALAALPQPGSNASSIGIRTLSIA